MATSTAWRTWSSPTVRKLYWTIVATRDIRVMLWCINFGRPCYTRNFYDGPHDLFTCGPLWIQRYA